MTSDVLLTTLAQNRKNLEELLNALGADHELPADPEKKAALGSVFHPSGPEAAKDVDMSDGERIAWMFQENSKALEAAAEAAGSRNAESPSVAESKGMRDLADALGGGQ